MGQEITQCLDTSPEANTSRQCETVLAESNRSDQQVVKLLLLGAGGCGKTTLFKQMKIIYNTNGYTREELEKQKDIVRRNILEIFQLCIQYAETNDLGLQETDFIGELKQHTNHTWQLKPDLVEPLQSLWAHPAIKKAFENRAKMDINDNAEYFIKDLGRLCAASYLPTNDDLLRVRQRTIGITENTFEIEKRKFKMVDVGGQRNERRKWIHAFDEVTCVIFVVALSEYDQVLAEFEDQNRMQESFKLFDDICNQRFFKEKPVMIFFNKSDIFAHKILDLKVNINVCELFQDYSGGLVVADAQNFIMGKFKVLGEQGMVKKDGGKAASSSSKKRSIYTYVTNATDTTAIRKIFETVRSIILTNILSENRME